MKSSASTRTRLGRGRGRGREEGRWAAEGQGRGEREETSPSKCEERCKCCKNIFSGIDLSPLQFRDQLFQARRRRRRWQERQGQGHRKGVMREDLIVIDLCSSGKMSFFFRGGGKPNGNGQFCYDATPVSMPLRTFRGKSFFIPILRQSAQAQHNACLVFFPSFRRSASLSRPACPRGSSPSASPPPRAGSSGSSASARAGSQPGGRQRRAWPTYRRGEDEMLFNRIYCTLSNFMSKMR